MYRAKRAPEGGPPIFDMETAGNDHEREQSESRGFVYGGKGEALAALERQEQEYAILAAERGHEVRYKLGEKAATEVRAKEDDAGLKHLPTIEETPIKRTVSRETK